MVSRRASQPVPPYEAQLALLVDAPPDGDEWLHEQKFDGYRIGIRIDGASVQLWSRRGQETKCLKRQEFVLGGFTDPEGSREAVGALLVGYYDNGHLRWAGKVGTGPGWTATYLRELRKRLDQIEISESPFAPPVADSWLRRHAHWVRPELVAEVAFGEWTDDGRIRHPSMQGLREDKAARDVVLEQPRVAPK